MHKDHNGNGLDESHSLDTDHDDMVVRGLHFIIRFAVRVMAVLMALLILWGVADVVWVLYQRLMEPPKYLLSISDILATFSAFLAVLIAIEIFTNITLYLTERVIHVKIVIATALMAVARKVIVFDYEKLGWEYVVATGVVVLGLGVTYWMISRPGQTPLRAG
jgi:uncharacterized membrane protein (DUF373 family)